MRLPTVNVRQLQFEDARQLHERLYAAFQAGDRIAWPVTPHNYIDEQQRLTGNLHKFWNTRGFGLRTSVAADKQSMALWLEVRAAKKPRAQRGDGVSRVKKVGPIVRTACGECGWRSDRRRDWLTFELGECRECGGIMQPRPDVLSVRADAKAKRELQEQGA